MDEIKPIAINKTNSDTIVEQLKDDKHYMRYALECKDAEFLWWNCRYLFEGIGNRNSTVETLKFHSFWNMSLLKKPLDAMASYSKSVLKNVTIEGCLESFEDLKIIFHRAPELEKLTLSTSFVNASGGGDFGRLGLLQSLVELNLSVEPNSQGYKRFLVGMVEACPSLERVKVGFSRFENEQALGGLSAALPALVGKTSALKQLEIRGDDDINLNFHLSIGNLRENKFLRELTLPVGFIDETSSSTFANYLKGNTQLEKLTLICRDVDEQHPKELFPANHGVKHLVQKLGEFFVESNGRSNALRSFIVEGLYESNYSADTFTAAMEMVGRVKTLHTFHLLEECIAVTYDDGFDYLAWCPGLRCYQRTIRFLLENRDDSSVTMNQLCDLLGSFNCESLCPIWPEDMVEEASKPMLEHCCCSQLGVGPAFFILRRFPNLVIGSLKNAYPPLAHARKRKFNER